jgi:hypothetical protein
MLVTANELGSKLVAANPPIESFEMRKFRGLELRNVWESKPKNATDELIAFGAAIRACVDPASCDVENLMSSLTIYDVWQLVVRQWQESGVPLQLSGVCNHPVYHIIDPDGIQSSVFSATDVPETATVVSVDSCGGHATSYLKAEDIQVVHVHNSCMEDAPLPNLSFPLLRQLHEDDYDTTDRVHLLRMVLANHEIDELEAADIMKTGKWLSHNTHGVRNSALLLCPMCGRQSTTTWQMNIGVFFE